jgi:hypothetical protein
VQKGSRLTVLIGILFLPLYAVAQDEPTIPLEKFYVEREDYRLRKFLKNLKFSINTGVGTTYFKHKLDGFGIYQSPSIGPYIFSGNTVPTNGYSQWIDTGVRDTILNAESGFLVSSDTAELGFKSKSFTVPLTASIHYEYKNFRIGGGYSKDFIFLRPFTPISYEGTLRKPGPNAGIVSTSKWFVMGGYSFAQLDAFVFTVDFRAGTNKFGKNFNRSLIKPSPFFSFGVTIEEQLSEYLRLFIRPSFEFKSYTMSLPGADQAIKHKSNALLWNVGITFSIPELPKCKIKECRIQMNHAHGNKEYRSRAHPFYQKQNPRYGENDPKLIKFQWRNRKKINPY